MQKEEILQTAVSMRLNKDRLGKEGLGALQVLHKCIKGVDLTEPAEERKKEKLISNLQSFWRGNSKRIDGYKRNEVQRAVKLVFGIGSEKAGNLNSVIRSFTFQELYLYYSYIEQIARSDIRLSELLYERTMQKQKRNTGLGAGKA